MGSRGHTEGAGEHQLVTVEEVKTTTDGREKQEKTREGGGKAQPSSTDEKAVRRKRADARTTARVSSEGIAFSQEEVVIRDQSTQDCKKWGQWEAASRRVNRIVNQLVNELRELQERRQEQEGGEAQRGDCTMHEARHARGVTVITTKRREERKVPSNQKDANGAESEATRGTSEVSWRE